MEEKTALPAPIETQAALSIDESAIASLSYTYEALKQFVGSTMKKERDYGMIPGTKQNTLLKPGAEKLARIFNLGSRIVDRQEQMTKGFYMVRYTVEVYRIRDGQAIAQCEGSANTSEKKFAEQLKERQGKNGGTYRLKTVGDLINTLQKMAQKRAFVGAVISATGASDFFTQDMEDFVEQRPRQKITEDEKLSFEQSDDQFGSESHNSDSRSAHN